MVTYKKKRQSTNKYITQPNALKYLHRQCEKALSFCQEQQLSTLEDFAQALEQISSQDNPKLKIAVELNDNGMTMSFSNKPEIGTTTGKYLMKNLGLEDENRFTRTGIETELNPEGEFDELDFEDEFSFDDDSLVSKPKSHTSSKNTSKKTTSVPEIDEFSFDDDSLVSKPRSRTSSKNTSKKTTNTPEIDDFSLDDDSLVSKQWSQTSSKNTNANEIDDLLDEIEHKSVQSQPSSTNKKQTTPNQIDYDSLLDQAAGLGELAARGGGEVDGTTIGGLTIQASALTTMIGKKAASQILDIASNARQQQRLKRTVSRLNDTLERTEQLQQREQELLSQFNGTNELDEDTSEDTPIGDTEGEEQPILDEHLHLPIEPEIQATSSSKSPLQKLANVLNRISTQLDNSPSTQDQAKQELEKGNQPLNKPFQLDPDASFGKQLDALNQRLDALDQRLDEFEARLDQLEAQISSLNSTPQEENTAQSFPEATVPNEVGQELTSPHSPTTIPHQEDKSNNPSAQRFAHTLFAVSEALKQRGEPIDNGVPIGEAILYASADAVSLESLDGKQLFAATKSNINEGEWKITQDLLADFDKDQAGNKLETELKQLETTNSPRTTKTQSNHQMEV